MAAAFFQSEALTGANDGMVLLVRHGESEWNRAFNITRIDPGIRDPVLTQTGRTQALGAGIALNAKGVRTLVTSPYRRALETATIIAEVTGATIEVEPLFGEHAAFSCDEGSPRTDLELAFPHLDLSRLEEIWWPEMEETEATMRRRMAEARAVLAGRDDRAHLAVVCHWGVIRALAGLTVGNCDIVPFEP
jgi:glucosyl-3-phosphoglycerate phosphatase